MNHPQFICHWMSLDVIGIAAMSHRWSSSKVSKSWSMDIYGYFRMVQNRHSPHSFHPKTSQNQSSPYLGSHPTPGRRVCRCHPRRQWSPSALRFFYRPEMTAVNSVHFFSSTPTYLGIISLVKDPFFPTQSQEKYWRGLRSPNAVWLYNKEMQNVNMWGCAKWIPICVHCMIF
jgi:hypothetical protein